MLVIGNAALSSRPPADYQLADAGRFFDTWRRTPGPRVLAHVPLGTSIQPGALPSCRMVRRLAARAAARHARLAYAPRPLVPVFLPAQSTRSPGWLKVDSRTIDTTGPGAATGRVRIAHSGTYRVEVEGEISRKLLIQVDGHTVGSISGELGPPGQITRVATVRLSAGPHQVRIVRAGSRLAPGAVTPSLLGPVAFVASGSPRVDSIAPAQARRLCGRRLDWIEIVHGR
jgi:hypothetical protein